MVEGSLAYVRKFYMSSQCTHTHPGTLSLFLCRTHTYGCTHKNRLLFLWKTGQQPHGQQTCVWRMCSLTHTISILCSVWLCVLECVLTVPCVLVCVCVAMCLMCVSVCRCVCACRFPYGRRATSDKAKAKACRCIFNQNNFKLCLENNSNNNNKNTYTATPTHTPIHTHTYSAAIKSLWFRRAIK